MKNVFRFFLFIYFLFNFKLCGWSPSMLPDSFEYFYMTEAEMERYRLPSSYVLYRLGAIVDPALSDDFFCGKSNSELLIEEVEDNDGIIGREIGFPRKNLGPKDLLKQYCDWRNYHNKNFKTRFGRWAFIFENKDAMKSFLKKLDEIAKKLKTTILHLLVELRFLSYLDQFVSCLKENEDEFVDYNINTIPTEKCLCKGHCVGPVIFYAALLNDDKAVGQLINSGANIYVKNRYGYTLLHVAIFRKNFKMIKLILDKYDYDKDLGRNVPDILNDKKNSTGHAPLHFAVWQLNLNVLFFLLNRDDIDPNPIDGGGQEVFHIIATSLHDCLNSGMAIDAIDRLIEKIKHYVPKTDYSGNYAWDYLKNDSDLKYIGEKIKNARETNYFWFIYYKLFVG